MIRPYTAFGDSLMTRRIATVLIALLALCTGASAQDGRKGIAFVQAVEQGGGVCTGATPKDAFACAKKKCVAEGAAAEDCMEQAWCYPGFWSVDLFVQSSDGPHWHEYFCGWNTKELALAAAKAACDPKVRKDVMECAPVALYDEDGKQYPVDP